MRAFVAAVAVTAAAAGEAGAGTSASPEAPLAGAAAAAAAAVAAASLVSAEPRGGTAGSSDEGLRAAVQASAEGGCEGRGAQAEAGCCGVCKFTCLGHVRTYPSFRFGGTEGTKVCTVAFRKGLE